jgi:hypothetical protein
MVKTVTAISEKNMTYKRYGLPFFVLRLSLVFLIWEMPCQVNFGGDEPCQTENTYKLVGCHSGKKKLRRAFQIAAHWVKK